MLLALLATSAQAERRFAFVAGIDRYPNLSRDMQLERAVADAEAVGDALASLGFQVTRLTGDVSQATFLRRFRTFAQDVQRGDTVLFFFSGHGIGLDGANYLLPADVPDLDAGDEPLIRARAVAEADLTADIERQGARVTIAVLDACRDNPFRKPGTRSLGLTRGLELREPAQGVFAIYSAGFNQRALDRLSDPADRDPNSVFTRCS
jgi:uncharacterized protein